MKAALSRGTRGPRHRMTGGAERPLDMPEMASPLLEPGANPFDTESAMSSGWPCVGSGIGLSFGRSLALGPVEKLGAIIDRDEEQATADHEALGQERMTTRLHSPAFPLLSDFDREDGEREARSRS